MANRKGVSLRGSQNTGAVGEHLRKSLVFTQPKRFETASTVGTNMTRISALQMFAPACRPRITEKIRES